MFCVFCGENLEENAKVCPNCGNHIIQAGMNDEITKSNTMKKINEKLNNNHQNTIPQYSPTKKEKKIHIKINKKKVTKNMFKSLGIIALFICSGFLFYYIYLDTSVGSIDKSVNYYYFTDVTNSTVIFSMDLERSPELRIEYTDNKSAPVIEISGDLHIDGSMIKNMGFEDVWDILWINESSVIFNMDFIYDRPLWGYANEYSNFTVTLRDDIIYDAHFSNEYGKTYMNIPENTTLERLEFDFRYEHSKVSKAFKLNIGDNVKIIEDLDIAHYGYYNYDYDIGYPYNHNPLYNISLGNNITIGNDLSIQNIENMVLSWGNNLLINHSMDLKSDNAADITFGDNFRMNNKSSINIDSYSEECNITFGKNAIFGGDTEFIINSGNGNLKIGTNCTSINNISVYNERNLNMIISANFTTNGDLYIRNSGNSIIDISENCYISKDLKISNYNGNVTISSNKNMTIYGNFEALDDSYSSKNYFYFENLTIDSSININKRNGFTLMNMTNCILKDDIFASCEEGILNFVIYNMIYDKNIDWLFNTTSGSINIDICQYKLMNNNISASINSTTGIIDITYIGVGSLIGANYLSNVGSGSFDYDNFGGFIENSNQFQSVNYNLALNKYDFALKTINGVIDVSAQSL